MVREMKNDAQFTIRLPIDLKEEMQESAKAADIDAVVWIRHAIREKLDREKRVGLQAGGAPTDAELDARIEAALRRMMEEMKKEG